MLFFAPRPSLFFCAFVPSCTLSPGCETTTTVICNDVSVVHVSGPLHWTINNLKAYMKVLHAGDGDATVRTRNASSDADPKTMKSYLADLFDWSTMKGQATLFGVSYTHKSKEFEALSSKAMWIHAAM